MQNAAHALPRSAPAGLPAGSRSRAGWLWGGVFAAFLLIYAASCQRGPAWQDSGIFQLRILDFDLAGRLGLALAHPLLIVLGKAASHLTPAEPSWGMNLVSSVFAAGAAANIALLVARLTGGRRAPALLAAGFFGLAHTPWWLASICESQMVYAALFTLELNVALWLLRRGGWRPVCLLGLVSGLSFTAHNLALLALPAWGLAVVVLSVRRRCPWWAAGAFVAAWLVGSSLLLSLTAAQAMQDGLAAAVRSTLFGASWQGAVTGIAGSPVKRGLGYVAYNLPNLALPAMAVGLLAWWRGREQARPVPPAGLHLVFAYLLGVYFLFAVRYDVRDSFMFFGPFYVMTAVLAGLGADHAGRRWRRWLIVPLAASVLWTPLVYLAAPSAFQRAGLALPGRRDLPRNHYRYWLWPWKTGEDSARQYARAALAEAPRGAIILADSTAHPPLAWVQRVERLRQDVEIVDLAHARGLWAPSLMFRGEVFVTSDVRGYYPASIPPEWLQRGGLKLLVRVAAPTGRTPADLPSQGIDR